MTTKLQNIESRLRAEFTKAEFEALETQARFMCAMKATKTTESFERLCEVGEELLKVRNVANPSARQFREGSKQDRAA